MIDPKKKYVTRKDRYPARVICTDRRGLCPVLALVDEGDCEVAYVYTADGLAGRESGLDLIEVPERVSRWVNIYPNSGLTSRQLADQAASPECGALLEIIYEGGQPVDVKLHPVEENQ